LKEGEFRFNAILAVSLLSFKPTEDDGEIELFLQNKINELFVRFLGMLHLTIFPNPKYIFMGNLAVHLAFGCQKIFYPRLKSEKIPTGSSFFAYDCGLEADGISPDLVLTLGQKERPLKIPLLLFEEKYLFDTLDEAISPIIQICQNDFFPADII